MPMGTVIMLDGADILIELIALISLVAGWFSKGLFYAIAGEMLFKPIARKIKKKAEVWEQTHPHLLKWAVHYLENHKGLHPNKGKCTCPQHSTS